MKEQIAGLAAGAAAPGLSERLWNGPGIFSQGSEEAGIFIPGSLLGCTGS